MDAVLSSGHSGLSTRARTDQASIGGVASIVALALLLSGCEATQGAATLLADLYTVRVAVVRATGHQAVQARIRDATILSVKLINPPFAALPDDARSGKARDIAKVAYAAYRRARPWTRCRSSSRSPRVNSCSSCSTRPSRYPSRRPS